MEVIILSSCIKQEHEEGFRSSGFWFMESQSRDRLAAEFFLEIFTFVLLRPALKAKQCNSGVKCLLLKGDLCRQ